MQCEFDVCCTKSRRNTHISESRIVHYPWHPWWGRSVFIETVIDKNGPIYFRCHVDETLHQAAVEIPEWMFDSPWSRVCAVERPIVGWQALRNLKLLLASASNNDPVAKEAEGFEGGPDATDAESKTTSIGIVPSIHSDSAMGQLCHRTCS